MRCMSMICFWTAATSTALVLCSSAVTPPPSNLNNDYCADVTETLTVENIKEPISTSSYRLCVDGTNMRWSQVYENEDPAVSTSPKMSIFNGTDFWQLFADGSLPGGYNCTHKVTGPELPSMMPYRMTDIDGNADLNKTQTYDNIAHVQNWYVFRPGKSSGGITVPSEQMHWYVNADTSKPYLLATECVQDCQIPAYEGKIQHGVRDFSVDRTDFVDLGLPSGVQCTSAEKGLSAESTFRLSAGFLHFYA
eukprot:g2207.t1